MFSAERFIAERVRLIEASGIRKVFELARQLKDPINLSIGQPDFDVPAQIKQAAAAAIARGMNSYTVTQGIAELHQRIGLGLARELPNWKLASAHGDSQILVTSGVSGGLLLAFLACLNPGDQVILADPYFVMYKHLVTLVGAVPVYVNTYPDFRLTAGKVEPLISPRTKMVLFNSPSNPTGVVSSEKECREMAELAERRGILLLSDEIYDEFCHEKIPRPGSGVTACPSPAAYSDKILLMRGFSKTYGMTGWRLGYVVGPKAIIEQMTKLQQYSFVCAPSMVQVAGVLAMDVDMTEYVAAYRRKRDMVAEKLASVFELVKPGGAFYAFPKVPEHLGMTGSQFVEKAIARNVVIIPGHVFSERDSHFRISYATSDEKLARGLDILCQLAKGKEEKRN
ncbi:MAG: aminotransferase class I/II-fold pyridoxal phosphate-dependent enzyme [Phycisphaeraceae bacterium]|nr:aminotransferase class I/II-fold pyridoxal phosphate-dependent enzyme [Phycisphaeraceae bacterium]